MSRYQDQVRDEFGRPVSGAKVYVFTALDALEALLDDHSVSLANPVTTDEFGIFSFNCVDGPHTLEVHFNGSLRWRQLIIVGAVGPAVPGAVTPEMFGAKGDGTTDDKVALQAWLDWGGMLWLPPRPTNQWYRCSAILTVRTLVNIDGVGLGVDPIDAPANGYQYLPGSRIVFDKNVGGFDIQPSTTLLIPDVVNGNLAAALTQRGAFGSTFKNIALIGNGGLIGKGGGTIGKGINCRTLTQMVNVQVKNFAEKGFDYQASATGDGSDASFGNLSNSISIGCGSEACGTIGLHVRGRDANTCFFAAFNAFGNGTVGIEDEAAQNDYHKPHCAGNPIALKMTGNQSNTITSPWVEDGLWQVGNGCVIEGADATSLNDPAYSPTTVHGARVRSKLIEAWGQNVVLTINSTNSNVAKASLQDNGTIRGYFGASASYAFSVYDSGVNLAAGVPLATTDWNVIGAYKQNGTTVINSSGVLQAAAFPALTGDVTTSAGSLATTLPAATAVSKIAGQAIAPLSVAIGSGTALTKAVVYTPSITPASVNAATVAEQTFTVTGLTTADKVIVCPPAIGNSTGIAGARVSAADTLAIRFINPTAGALTPTSGTYTVLALRS